MGPPSDYAELAGQEKRSAAKNVSVRYVAILAIILTAVTAILFLLPSILQKNSMPNVSPDLKQLVAQNQQAEEQKIKAAIDTAKSWLQLIDEEKYGESWSQTAEIFRNIVPQQQWISSLTSLRKPMGKMLSRKVLTGTYTTQVPGAADGQYVIIQFETSFENKQNLIETVTPMRESDGQWRVSGYYIK